MLSSRELVLGASIPLLLMVIGTFNRNETWKSAHRLWLDSSLKSPNKARPRVNLAREYQLEGDYMNAIREYNNGLLLYQMRPDREIRIKRQIIAMNLGQMFMNLNQWDLAQQVMVKEWNADPGFPGLAINLGKSLSFTGNAEIALEVLDAGIARRENYKWFTDNDAALLYKNKAEILRGLKRDCREIMDNLRMAARLNPDFRTIEDCTPY